MPNFHVIDLTINAPVLDKDGEVVVFHEGTAAAAYAKELASKSRERGFAGKFKVRQIEDNNWQERELCRLEDGTYTILPWDGADGFCQRHRSDYHWFIANAVPAARHHYAHASKKFPGNVAFTESAAKGMRDLKTSMRPGRYLRKYYEGLSNSSIERLSSLIVSRFGDIKLQFATTPEEIERVYLKGPQSCMSHEVSDYETGGYHPVKVYGAGDLAVAYLTVRTKDDDGEEETVTARCICWPGKRLYGRLYGDSYKLGNLLRDLGYEEEWYFGGAKLIRKPRYDNFIVPYIDGGRQTVRDNGEFLIIDNAGCIKCDNTCGLSGSVPACAHCGEVHGLLVPVEGGGLVCSTCLDDNYSRCEYTNEYVSEVFEVITPNGVEMWGERTIEDYTFACSGNGNTYSFDMEDRGRRNGAFRYSVEWSRENPVVMSEAVCTPVEYEIPDVVQCFCRACRQSPGHALFVYTQTGETVR